MVKTTVYLPDELKRRLELTATTEGRSEAEVIRIALVEYTERNRPRPRLPLFTARVRRTWPKRRRVSRPGLRPGLILVDSGGLFAALVATERHHEAARRVLETDAGP